MKTWLLGVLLFCIFCLIQGYTKLLCKSDEPIENTLQNTNLNLNESPGKFGLVMARVPVRGLIYTNRMPLYDNRANEAGEDIDPTKYTIADKPDISMPMQMEPTIRSKKHAQFITPLDMNTLKQLAGR